MKRLLPNHALWRSWPSRPDGDGGGSRAGSLRVGPEAISNVMKRLALLLVVAVTVLCGCVHRSEPRFVRGTGDAGQFILRQAIARGGQPITTNGLPAITGAWRYSEDEDGVIIRLSRKDYEGVETLLRQAFGAPNLGPSDKTDGGKLGVYRLTPKGGSIQFGYDSDGTHVIVLRQFTTGEFDDVLTRAMKVMGESR